MSESTSAETNGSADPGCHNDLEATTPRDSGRGHDGQKRVLANQAAPGFVAGELLGYARVSLEHQRIDRQVEALTAAGVKPDYLFLDHGYSGGIPIDQRPGMRDLMARLRPGDTIVIHELSRAGRSASDLLTWVEGLHERDVSLRILTLDVDSRTPIGKLVLGVVASISEVERELLRERVRHGLESARAAGRKGGRPPALTPEKRTAALNLVASGTHPKEVARILGCSERTIRRLVAEARS